MEEMTVEEARDAGLLGPKKRLRVKGEPVQGQESEGEIALLTRLRQLGLADPEPQYKIKGTRLRLDLAYPQARLCIEVQGGIGMKMGSHDSFEGYRKDCRRMAKLIIMGWRLMYFTTDMAVSGEAALLVQAALEAYERGDWNGDRSK